MALLIIPKSKKLIGSESGISWLDHHSSDVYVCDCYIWQYWLRGIKPLTCNVVCWLAGSLIEDNFHFPGSYMTMKLNWLAQRFSTRYRSYCICESHCLHCCHIQGTSHNVTKMKVDYVIAIIHASVIALTIFLYLFFVYLLVAGVYSSIKLDHHYTFFIFSLFQRPYR